VTKPPKSVPTESLKLAIDVAKQIITLASVIITLTVTFAKDLGPSKDGPVPLVIKLAWLGYGAAIVFAVWTMLALTGTMRDIEAGNSGLNIDASNVRLPAAGMVLSFIAGIALTIVAGWTAVR
jgi:hypothetical protein